MKGILGLSHAVGCSCFRCNISLAIFARKGLRNKNLFEASMLVVTACCLAFPLPSL
jgi:hypothetical protein